MENGTRKALAKKYNGMKQRCYNPNNSEYNNYGGRGISICKEWLDDVNQFLKWAVENGYEVGLTIDRIDVNGNYCPENCRWIPMEEQSKNRRNNVIVDVGGEKMTIAEAGRRLGMSESTIRMRAKRGKDVDSEKYVREKHVIRDDGEIYNSIAEAASFNIVHPSKISAVCRGVRAKTRGHSFRFLTREEAEAALAKKTNVSSKRE